MGRQIRYGLCLEGNGHFRCQARPEAQPGYLGAGDQDGAASIEGKTGETEKRRRRRQGEALRLRIACPSYFVQGTGDRRRRRRGVEYLREYSMLPLSLHLYEHDVNMYIAMDIDANLECALQAKE